MPELPEVTVIVNQLNKKLRGLVLSGVEYDWPKKFYWGKFSIKDLKGKRVEKVERRGKVVIIKLVNGSLGNWAIGEKKEKPNSLISAASYAGPDISEERHSASGRRRPADIAQKPNNLSILIHLKLTGQLIYQDAKTRIAGGHPIPPLNLPVPNKTTRVIFGFGGVSHLYFNDMRKFGWVKIVDSSQSTVDSAIGELGPDPLVMSYGEFCERLAKRGQARIKKLLMDQTFVSGIGNIYSDEALWRAKIHPNRSAVSLSSNEIKSLFRGLQDSLKLAIAKGGSSANAYVDSGGEKGLYLSFAKAYHMTGKPCERCKTPIVRQKMDGRSAHFCPRCQRLN